MGFCLWDCTGLTAGKKSREYHFCFNSLPALFICVDTEHSILPSNLTQKTWNGPIFISRGHLF